jgi:hypothetical protein
MKNKSIKNRVGDKIPQGEILQIFNVKNIKYKKVYAVKVILDGEEIIRLINEEDIIK